MTIVLLSVSIFIAIISTMALFGLWVGMASGIGLALIVLLILKVVSARKWNRGTKEDWD